MHIIEPIAWQMGMYLYLSFSMAMLTFQDTTRLESWKFPASGQVPRNNDPNTVEPLLRHTPRWMAQGMPYEGLCLSRDALKIDSK